MDTSHTDKSKSGTSTKGKPNLNLATKDISTKDIPNSDSFPSVKETSYLSQDVKSNLDISKKDNSNSSKKSNSEKRADGIADDLIDDSIHYYRTPRDHEGISLLFIGLLNKFNTIINYRMIRI